MKKIDKKISTQAGVLEDAIEITNDPALIDSSETSTDTTTINMNALPPELQPSDEAKGQFDDLLSCIVNKVRETGKVVPAGHGILSAEQYKGTTPDIQVTPKPTTEGFSSQDSVPDVPKVHNKNVRSVTDLDLANLDESQIMAMPFISAGDFQLVDMLNLKPKDPAIRFRWVNFKNAMAANYSRYIALGFQVASTEDVDKEKTPVPESMVNGTKVEYYDIQLMKIHVLKLMSLYKRNVVSSLGRIRNFQETGQRAAQEQFDRDIASNPANRAGLAKMRAAMDGQEPIEFYDPNTRG